jgi:FlaG/FlaF family flagellin (archaellin)
VSAISGSILLIVVTVIVASFTWAFVIDDLSAAGSDRPPEVQFRFEGDPGGYYAVVHADGESFDAARMRVEIREPNGRTTAVGWGTGTGTVSVGDSFTLPRSTPNGSVPPQGGGDTIAVVWTPEDGGPTTVDSFTVPAP